MNHIKDSAAVLWTGGKDSCLSFYEASGLGYNITSLITFAPENAKFLAHPISIIKLQADSIGIPHRVIIIQAPFRENYELEIQKLKNEGIQTLITGDIDLVDGAPNWIRECSQSSGIHVFTPLWQRSRDEILEKMLSLGFEIILSCVKKPWFTMDWVGLKLDFVVLSKFREMNLATGLDICGENGEYHSLVLDAPIFKKRIFLKESIAKEKDNLFYLEIEEAELIKI